MVTCNKQSLHILGISTEEDKDQRSINHRISAAMIWKSANNIKTRIIKTFSIKMEKDVGTSKPKKHVNKVGG